MGTTPQAPTPRLLAQRTQCRPTATAAQAATNHRDLTTDSTWLDWLTVILIEGGIDMLDWPHVEDTILLTIILIDSALLLVLLFKNLNRTRGSSSSRRLYQLYFSTFSSLLAFLFIGTFTFISLQDQSHIFDDVSLPPLPGATPFSIAQ